MLPLDTERRRLFRVRALEVTDILDHLKAQNPRSLTARIKPHKAHAVAVEIAKQITNGDLSPRRVDEEVKWVEASSPELFYSLSELRQGVPPEHEAEAAQLERRRDQHLFRSLGRTLRGDV